MVTRKIIAKKIISYLKHEITLEDLVNWSENSVMDEEFEPNNYNNIMDVLSRLGLADVKAFGITIDDCEQLLTQLGYKLNFEVVEIN